MSRAWRLLTAAGTGLAIAGALHAAANLRLVARPAAPPDPIGEPVSVLIPARDEAARIRATVVSALAQRGLPEFTVTVLDDGSSDRTAQVARQTGGGDGRLTVRSESRQPPAGWLGKPFACQRLADGATGSVLVFLDADVVLAPDAISGAVHLLRASGADFASVWPRQLADGLLPRLVQPLQQWSWVTTLPLRLAGGRGRPSLAAANGQFLVMTAAAYRSIGGHRAVACCVLEDIELARAMKRAGFRTALWDGSRAASCRMYASAGDLRAGYRKSLWAAFGPRDASVAVRAGASAAVWAILLLAYVVPPAAALAGPDRRCRTIGALGYCAAVANRALVARRTGSPVWPDSLAHPLSIAAFVGLSVDSLLAHGRGTTQWKGRPVAVHGGGGRRDGVAPGGVHRRRR